MFLYRERELRIHLFRRKAEIVDYRDSVTGANELQENCYNKRKATFTFTLNVYGYLCNILNKIYFSFLLLFNRSLDDKINKRGFLLLLLQYKTQAGIIRQPSSRPGSSLLSHLVVFGKEQGTLIKKTRRDRARKRHLMTSK